MRKRQKFVSFDPLQPLRTNSVRDHFTIVAFLAYNADNLDVKTRFLDVRFMAIL